jgi:hypothetical protein
MLPVLVQGPEGPSGAYAFGRFLGLALIVALIITFVRWLSNRNR